MQSTELADLLGEPYENLETAASDTPPRVHVLDTSVCGEWRHVGVTPTDDLTRRLCLASEQGHEVCNQPAITLPSTFRLYRGPRASPQPQPGQVRSPNPNPNPNPSPNPNPNPNPRVSASCS